MHGNGLAPKHLTEQTIITNFQVNRIMKKLIKHFTENQKTLFLIDSIGAFMTAFSLFVIVRQLNEYFGMPKNELTPKNPFALFGMIGSIWSGVSAISKMTDEQKYRLTNGRDAIIRLERSPNKELVIGQIVFVKN